jgi:hypothetical protein
MKKYVLLTFAAAFGLLSITLPSTVRPAHAGQGTGDFVPPIVFRLPGQMPRRFKALSMRIAALGNG